MILAVETFKQCEAVHALVTHLAVLHRVVVANHVDVEEVLDLCERHHRMLGIVLRTAQVGILAGEGNEIHVVLRALLGIVGGKCDDAGGTRSIVVGTGIENIAAEIAEVVVVCRENEAAVMPTALHLGDDVEALVALEETVVDIGGDAASLFREVGRHPDDGLVHHLLAVSFVELQRLPPGVDHAGILALGPFFHLLKILPMLVDEPEVAHHHAALVLRLRQVAEYLLRVIVQRVNIVEGVSAVRSWRVFAHHEVHARCQLLAVNRQRHFFGEGVDIQLERLQCHLVHPRLAELLFQILSCFVGTAIRIPAALILGGTQFLDNLLVKSQILGKTDCNWKREK